MLLCHLIAFYFKILFLLNFRSLHGRMPDSSDSNEIQEIQMGLLSESSINSSYFENDAFVIPNTWASFLPTCSVVGGILAQEVIKVMTKVGAPVHNFFVYSASDFCGRSFFLNDETIER